MGRQWKRLRFFRPGSQRPVQDHRVSQIIQRAFGGGVEAADDMGVDHGGLDAGVAEILLYLPDVDTF